MQTLIVISLAYQLLTVYHGSERVEYTISSGSVEHPTPTGEYVVTARDRDHVSNRWPKPNGGAKMPYALLLRDGLALHAGDVSKPRASHGCIRLSPIAARHLYSIVTVGTRVLITAN